MQVRIDQYHGATIRGINVATSLRDGRNLREIDAAWQRVSAGHLLAGVPGRGSDFHPFLGVISGFDHATTDFNYLIGVPVTAASESAEGFTTVTVPAGQYAVLTTDPAAEEADFIRAIQQGWQYLMHDWFPASGYQHAGTPDFELYDERGEPGLPNRTMEIWMPVKR
ncbi:GyrI-like domain-containing protein [Andreprevotia chitinilytica]|uniref:GyrI-like domain-containing protein n=1 Tax=Andreprevotia chitinilytica TaxID=396808 RepID=UPI00068C01B4|nr:GyrI-like domain-containing protein [Andreprevotia chitinilytica]